MSGFVCRHCGGHEDIFGSGQGSERAQKARIPFLGAIPLSRELCDSSDRGLPFVLQSPALPAAKALCQVAENLVAELSIRALSPTASASAEPLNIDISDRQNLKLQWPDGSSSVFSALDLRYRCRCALCVNELTGERSLKRESLPANLSITNAERAGRYGLKLRFSDGHDQGIYTYIYLHELLAHVT
jgi:ATP-binding protein involved in chromosome partitioning